MHRCAAEMECLENELRSLTDKCEACTPAVGALGSSFGGDGLGTGGPALFSVGDLNEEAPGLKLNDAAAGFILKDGLPSVAGSGEALSA